LTGKSYGGEYINTCCHCLI